MKYNIAIPALCLTAVLMTVVLADPAPKPSIVPTSWELDFDYEVPRPITMILTGEKKSRTFWYMIYTITNRSGADRIFVPEFVLYTDTGMVYRAGERIPAEVFLKIQKRHSNPLLKSLAEITGTVLQGEDNARHSVAIWQDFDHKARGFDIFAAGLSGEVVKIKLPKPVVVTIKDRTGKIRKVTKTETILSKTLHLNYSLPGIAAARKNTPPGFRGKRWVMR